MKGEENHFSMGVLVSLILHLAIIGLLTSAVNMTKEFPLEPSVEISLADYEQFVEKKKPQQKESTPNPKTSKTKPKKPDKKKNEKKPQPKKKPSSTKPTKQESVIPLKKQKELSEEIKPEPAKPPEPVEPEPESARSPDTPENLSEETGRLKKNTESEKKQVLRKIRKESVLETLKKPTERDGPQKISSGKSRFVPSKPHVTSEKTKRGIVSLVLDVYYKSISRQIEKTLILPPDVGPESILSATVSFYMKATGYVYDAKIDRSSGNQRFDSYCIRAVNISSPLPAPPVELADRIKTEPFIIPCESSN